VGERIKESVDLGLGPDVDAAVGSSTMRHLGCTAKRLAPRTLKAAPATRIFTATQRPRSLVRTALRILRNYRYEIGFLILVRTTSR
jgi:hypothetical protein